MGGYKKSKTVMFARSGFYLGRWTYRFVSGLEMDGERRTDASWRHRGQDLVPGVRHAHTWNYLPRAHRALWRIGILALVIGLSIGYVVAPAGTYVGIQVVMGFGVCVLVHWMWGKFEAFEARHRWVGPLSVVLGARWGVDPKAILPGIKVPRGHKKDPDQPVEITLPADYRETDRAQDQTAKLIARKVGIPAKKMDYEVDLEGLYPVLKVRAQEVPPETVDFDTALPYLEQVTGDRLFLGLGIRDEPAWLDLALDSPHLALSFGSGAGKSTVVRSLAAQVLRTGGRVVIFDFAKEGDSHADWVFDRTGTLLPGIELYRTVPDAHQGLLDLQDERTIRSSQAFEAKRFGRPDPDLQRVLVVFEEMNTSTPQLERYWRSIRATEDSMRSPAVDAIGDLVCTGRAGRMNCIAVAQRFDAKVIGGGDVRANFMIRILSRFDEQARRMLIPEITDPKPRSSNVPGRMVLAVAGQSAMVQGTYLTSDETREWALGGTDRADVRPTTAVEPAQTITPDTGDQVSPGTRLHLVRPVEAAPPREVTISEAVEEGIVSGSKDAVRRASSRDDRFPAVRGRRGAANTYYAYELAEWDGRRNPVGAS